MATRKQIHDAFVAAKKEVAANEMESSWGQSWKRKHEFICHALDDLVRAHREGSRAAKALIEQRFKVGRGVGTNIQVWLQDVAKVPAHQLTRNSLQAYRHRWLDSVIKEFS